MLLADDVLLLDGMVRAREPAARGVPVTARRYLRHWRDLPHEPEYTRVVQGAAHIDGVLPQRRANLVVVVGGDGQHLVVALNRFEN